MTTLEFDLTAARGYIDVVRWKFARTMAFAPHEYTVREWEPEREPEFDAFVTLIREAGELRYWPVSGRRREVNPSLDVDGWEYWSVGDPVGVCKIINRAVLPEGSHPGTIPAEELEHACWMNAQRGRRVRFIAHGPGARRRPAQGRRPVSYEEGMLPVGIEGSVMMVDTLGQFHIRWDDLSRSALREGPDDWEWLA